MTTKILGILLMGGVVFCPLASVEAASLTREHLQRQIFETLAENPQFRQVVEGGKVMFSLINPTNVIEVPGETFTTELVCPANTDFLGRFAVEVRIFVGEQLYRKVWASVQVDLFKGVYFARKPLRKGESLAASNLELRVVNIAELAGGTLMAGDDLAGMQVSRSIPAGASITRDMLETTALARRGEVVSLLVRNATVTVSCKGILLEDGYLDQPVRVQNIDSKKIVHGRLVSAGLVLVNL
ncbi:MAG: flagella basal body P-ring formation protein FlgA [Deltaproteobacteria bacterium RIFOXYA12_FULL_61_11]|nr:MAG: flagella basal body P-ring formation protein FlgA [Deltaproteobacteria bacterium RIFOXYA12_FULL_61_11]